MKVLFITDNFPPETNAPASRTYEHVRRWVEWGHEVTVITCAPNFPTGKVYPGYRNAWRAVEVIDGIRVVRVKTYITANAGFFRRVLDYVSFGLSASVFGLFETKPDIVIGTSPQLFSVVAARFLSAVKRVPFVFELRDLWPESIATVGAARKGLLLQLLERLVHHLYCKADLIVSVTESFKQKLIADGIRGDKIVVVRNGVDLTRFSAQLRDEQLAEEWGVKGKFVAGYFGTHGMAHDLENVLKSADLLRDDKDIVFVLLGDGAEKKNLIRKAEAMGLPNVRFVESVPKERMPAAWSVCDLALVHLKDDPLFANVIPSKIFEACGAGRGMLVVQPQGEAVSLVLENGIGEWVPPGEPEALAERVRGISRDRVLLDKYMSSAKQAAAQFSRASQADRMLTLLSRLVLRQNPQSIDSRY